MNTPRPLLAISVLAVLFAGACSWNYSGATTGHLTGGAAAQVGAITLRPSTTAYQPRKIGTSSPAHVFTLTNPATNSGAAVVSTVQTSDNQFVIDSTTTTCTGQTLQPGGNCQVGVGFSPVNIGPQTASLSVEDNAANSPQTAILTGAGKR